MTQKLILLIKLHDQVLLLAPLKRTPNINVIIKSDTYRKYNKYMANSFLTGPKMAVLMVVNKFFINNK